MRVFYDWYYNKLKSYDDINCETQDKKSSFTSEYNDYSIGAYPGYVVEPVPNDVLRFGGNFKRDVHRAHDDDEPWIKMADNFYSFAVENCLDVADNWQFSNRKK